MKCPVFIKSFFALSIFCISFTSLESYKYDLAICAIFRNEARFMKEWIEFHKLVGVQHFYLYNHFSEDNYLEILQPYIDTGEVELIDWTLEKIDHIREDGYYNLAWQPQAYDDCLKKVKGIVKWLAVIDLDEFLLPVKKMSLIDFLKDYEEYGGICPNWVMFGTSNVDKVPDDKLMIECLTMCDPKGDKTVKSIVRPERVVKMHHVHRADYKKGFFDVNSDKQRIRGKSSFSSYILLDKLRINHYWTGDGDRLLHVKLANKLAMDSLEIQYIERLKILRDWLNKASTWNVTEDVTIHKYLGALKEKMKA